MSHDLARLADRPDVPFAVLHRAGGPGVEVLTGAPGDVLDVDRLADLPLPAPGDPPVLAMVPFRQVAELGFAHHDDDAPLRCLRVRERHVLTLAEALAGLPTDAVPLADAAFDVDDDAYREVVKHVVDEIGRGEGANFVIRRELHARQPLPPARAALAVLRRLLAGEPGAYWTFAVHLPAPTGDPAGRVVTAVGATPERHVSLRGGEVVMNPISGTFRYPAEGPTRERLLTFLRDRKEVEELFMVVDEELKMMSRLCSAGGRVHGPLLKPMGHLTHTEYLLTGRCDADVRDVLRATMFAATVTGSPLENACRVINRYEPTGRGYYSGLAALIGTDDAGRPELDAPILIRTAYLAPDGGVRVPVGATLVRQSVPEHEVAETHAKSAGVLAAFTTPTAPGAPAARSAAIKEFVHAVTADPRVAAALADRNAALARFWLDEQADRPDPRLAGRSALVVDAEDAWTAMLAHLLRRLGMTAQVRRWDALAPSEVAAEAGAGAADLLVAGPGPGDPRDLADPRIAALHGVIAARLATGRPLLAVCLSHQITAARHGLPIEPLARPHQGTQRAVRVFGRDVRVGFYNTFTARDRRVPGVEPAPGLEVHAVGDEVVALRGPGFASVQFHLESILSPDGVDLLTHLAGGLLEDRLGG